MALTTHQGVATNRHLYEQQLFAAQQRAVAQARAQAHAQAAQYAAVAAGSYGVPVQQYPTAQMSPAMYHQQYAQDLSQTQSHDGVPYGWGTSMGAMSISASPYGHPGMPTQVYELSERGMPRMMGSSAGPAHLQQSLQSQPSNASHTGSSRAYSHAAPSPRKQKVQRPRQVVPTVHRAAPSQSHDIVTPAVTLASSVSSGSLPKDVSSMEGIVSLSASSLFAGPGADLRADAASPPLNPATPEAMDINAPDVPASTVRVPPSEAGPTNNVSAMDDDGFRSLPIDKVAEDVAQTMTLIAHSFPMNAQPEGMDAVHGPSASHHHRHKPMIPNGTLVKIIQGRAQDRMGIVYKSGHGFFSVFVDSGNMLRKRATELNICDVKHDIDHQNMSSSTNATALVLLGLSPARMQDWQDAF